MELREISNRGEWESFINTTSIPLSFFQSYSWGEFERELGNEVFRYGIYIDNNLKGLLQAVLVKAKRGRFLHIRNGPIFDFSNNLNNLKLIELLQERAKELKCDFLRLSPLIPKENEHELEGLGLYLSQMHDVDAEVTWILDLDITQDELLMNMRKTTRYLIRQASKLETLKIISSDDISLLDKFFEVYDDTVKRHGWHAYSHEYIKKEFAHFKDNIRLFLAEYEGKVIAGSLFIYYKDEVYYHHSGSLSEYQKVPAMYLLHWESIKYAKEKGYRTYNLFGIARENDKKHPWAGLTLFKQGFGGRVREYIHAKDLPLTKKYWLTHMFEKLERKRRGYR